MLVLGAALIIGAAVTAFSLRNNIIGAEAFPVGGEFRAKQEDDIRNWRLGLGGCVLAFIAGGAICRAGYRVYDAGNPSYGRGN